MRWSYFEVDCPTSSFMKDFTWDKITVRAVFWGGGYAFIQRVVGVARKNNSMRKLDPPTPSCR